MNNTKVLEEFFIWEENNSIEPKNNCLNNNESVHYDTTTEIKNDSIKKDWRDITDPKLRKKMREKAWREANKDKVRLKAKNWEKNNRVKRNLRKKIWRKENKDYYKSKQKISRKKWSSQPKNKNKKNEYHRKKLKTDVQYKLSHNLRCRLYKFLNHKRKAGSAVKDLGCNINELKTYLESKFLPGMSWDNHGQYGWHIDHIKPLSSFDLSDRDQFLQACHYTNLQPLWWQDNLTKSDKLIVN